MRTAFSKTLRSTLRLSNVLRAVGAVLLLLLLLLLGVAVAPAGAQQRIPASIRPPKDICIYRAAPYRAGTRVVSVSRGANGKTLAAATAQIALTFSDDFPTPARQALRAAADIWETSIHSTQEITIDADWEDLGSEDALANAGATILYSKSASFPNAPAPGVFYAVALANSLQNEDLNGDEPEITATFNSARDDWYFGSGTPGEDQIDFTSVAVHEIAHGLGFFGSMTVEDDEGSWGITEQERPVAYDTFAEGLGGAHLTDTGAFPNPSEELADTLRSDSVFFDGPQARSGSAAGNQRPELYAPEEWSQGSSFSHLDEDTYPPGDVNSLMTPFVGFQEVIQNPGGIVCGIFADMGWPLGPDCEALLFEDLVAFEASFLTDTDDTVELDWTIAGDADVTSIEVRQAEKSGPFEEVSASPVHLGETSICQEGTEGATACTLRLGGLQPGAYRFQLILTGGDGSRTPGPVREAFVQPQRPGLVESYPNPFHQRATVRVVLRDDQEPQRVVIGLYDALGRLIRRVADEHVSGEVRRPLRAGALSDGVYFLRVIGEDFTETQELVLVR